jgi:hypothetical protein
LENLQESSRAEKEEETLASFDRFCLGLAEGLLLPVVMAGRGRATKKTTTEEEEEDVAYIYER